MHVYVALRYNRMKQMPEYNKIVECRGRGVDIDKLRYYNTKNINKYYDGAKAMLIDSWKVAVAGPSPQEEVVCTCDPRRCIITSVYLTHTNTHPYNYYS